MSMPNFLLLAIANSIARITSLVRPPPFLSRTLRPTNCTAGATPSILDVGEALQAADQAGDVRAVTVIVERRAWRGSPPP